MIVAAKTWNTYGNSHLACNKVHKLHQRYILKGTYLRVCWKVNSLFLKLCYKGSDNFVQMGGVCSFFATSVNI